VEVGGWEDEPKEGSLDGSWLFPLRTGSFWRSKASNENEPVIDPEPGTLYESWSLPGATPNATLGERGIELMDVGDMETDQMDWLLGLRTHFARSLPRTKPVKRRNIRRAQGETDTDIKFLTSGDLSRTLFYG